MGLFDSVNDFFSEANDFFQSPGGIATSILSPFGLPVPGGAPGVAALGDFLTEPSTTGLSNSLKGLTPLGQPGQSGSGNPQVDQLTSVLSNLLPGGNQLQQFLGLGSEEATALNRLQGASLLGAASLQNQLALNEQFIPKIAQQQLFLQQQLVPEQLKQIQGFQGQALSGAINNIFSTPLTKELVSSQDPISFEQAQNKFGVNELLEGGLPDDVKSEIFDTFAQQAETLGIPTLGSPSGAQDLLEASSLQGLQLRESLLGSRQGLASDEFRGRLTGALNVRQALGLPTTSGLLSGQLGATGLPEANALGLGTFFQGQGIDLIQSQKERREANRAGAFALGGSILDVGTSFIPFL